jgi:hypothetical protein
MDSTFDINLKKRMAETMNSELDPELISPVTAGAEELPYYEETFPLSKQFRQSNMGEIPYSRNTNRMGKKPKD